MRSFLVTNPRDDETEGILNGLCVSVPLGFVNVKDK